MNTETDFHLISGEELAKRLDIAKQTIFNNSPRIIGRVKIGRIVRYDWSKIMYSIQTGKNIFVKAGRK